MFVDATDATCARVRLLRIVNLVSRRFTVSAHQRRCAITARRNSYITKTAKTIGSRTFFIARFADQEALTRIRIAAWAAIAHLT